MSGTGNHDRSRRELRIVPGSVCKPCWELHYCPYGAFVEYFPLPGGERLDREKLYDRALDELTSGVAKTESDVYMAIQELLYNDPTKWDALEGYDQEDVACRIFGHSCPVFFLQSSGTETREPRRTGRFIAREIMFKVVRRDNHICQACHTYVPDDQLEFDHVIPIARGGPTTVENLRLLCRNCNASKSDKVDDLLVD